MKRDFISIADWTSEELWQILRLSKTVKEYPQNYYQALQAKSLAMIFEKQSLRTHVTFDLAIHQLGGHCVYLSQGDINLGKRESVYDVAKNMERWVNAVVVRTYLHRTCVEMAGYIKIPLINALTDYEHPCQAVGDFFTLQEQFGDFRKRKLAFVGEGNNVCHSFMLMAGKLGGDLFVASPAGYGPKKEIIQEACREAQANGTRLEVLEDPKEAVRNADVVYTDTWVSMGQEAEEKERLEVFREYQVNAKLMQLAKSSAVFMHNLPAHRGQEVTNEVIDSTQSIVFDQAENRLHTQKAILVTLLGEV